MKVTYNWLKEMVDIDVSPEELAIRLTSAGMEVEEIIYQNEHLHHVVVGKILKIEKHPQADRLVVCQVDIGKEIVQIITAATNVFEGALVPVSLEGADLCNGIKISKTKIRGVDSLGMFCSGEELGIDENYMEGAGVNGILILPNDLKPGIPIDKALMLDDVVFDIGITPNRADCMSVIGIAREVCALLGREMKKINLSYDLDVYAKDTIWDYVSVDVKTPNCYRYMASAVTNVKIEKSPLWMRARLNAVGVKPINTMVDITNYVLIECGQPMHAFDQKNIDGNKIVVRQAQEGESIDALNHNSYNLDESVMVIADDKRPMVIAGVIGGMDSCITDNTQTCVFESAVFDLKSIRLTSRKFGVRTDSSARYAKGVNVANAELGLNRALHLVSKLKCGKVVRGRIDIASKENKARRITGSVSTINDILGVTISSQDMVRILNNLGIVTKCYGNKLECEVPPYREDIENDYDLAEEVIRMYGYDVYDKLGYNLFEHATITEGLHHPRLWLERQFRNALVQHGFFENVSYTLVSGDINQKLMLNEEENKLVRIANPIGEEISCMRTSLAHSLLQNIAYNLSLGNKEIRFFECGRTYKAKKLPLDELPVEKNMLAIAVYEDDYNFFNLKAEVENILNMTSCEGKIVRSNKQFLHPGISADYLCGEEIIASFGKLHPVVCKNYELPENVYYAEINTEFLAELPVKRYNVNAISKFPIVDRDLAVVVDENVTCGELIESIKSSCGKLCYDVSLFDVYRSASLGENKKSMAFNIKLSDIEKTLTDEDVSSVMNRVLKALSYKFGASLR
ncbi:MAG: phenylalanine--tRNA ligase subunit beta [Clostridia bacterium]|nr:phenylalanine--tRNA ligase subunit beta [Clostridia bacterium]